jgi:hypothetical protein
MDKKTLIKVLLGILLVLIAGFIGETRLTTSQAMAKIDSVRELHVTEMAANNKDTNEAFYEIGRSLGANEASHIAIKEELKYIRKELTEIKEMLRETNK